MLVFMSHLVKRVVGVISIVDTSIIIGNVKIKNQIEKMVGNLLLMIHHPKECNSSLVLKMMMKNTFLMISLRKWMNCVTEMEKSMNGKKLPDG